MSSYDYAMKRLELSEYEIQVLKWALDQATKKETEFDKMMYNALLELRQRKQI